MEQSKIIEELSCFLNNYEEYKERAIQLEWIEIEEEHADWFIKYPLGISIDVLRFPKAYVCDNFKDAYVRSILPSMAYWEGWEADFWNISDEKRREIFSACGKREQDVYRTYFEIRDLRLKAIMSDFLIKEIRYFAKENGIEESELEQYTEMVRDAVCIELGGSYVGDFSYLAIWEDTLIFIDCGVWD